MCAPPLPPRAVIPCVDDFGTVFRHALRPRILTLIDAWGEGSPSDLAAALDVRVSTVAYHTKVLHEIGWLVLDRTERRRGGSRHVYRIATRPYIDDDGWERLPRALRRALTHLALGEIFGTARTALKAGGFDASGAHVDRLRLRLDDDGTRALSDVLSRALQDAQRLQDQSDERAAADRDESLLVILHYLTPMPKGPQQGR